MNAPSAWARYRLLMGLRTRLWARAAGQSPGRLIAFIFGLFFSLAWGAFLGVGVYTLVRSAPDLATQSVHAVCLGVFLTQVILGMVSLAVAEFFDVSRLLHLPIGYREVFAAMASSGVLAPIALMYAGPLIGATLALDSGGALIPWRLVLVVLQVALGHVVALTVNLVFLSIMTRRRVRDLATILASLIGMGFYLTWQLAVRGGASMDTVAAYPLDGLRWIPTAWLADLFLAERPWGTLLAEGAGFVAFMVAALALGARLLRKSFLGHMPSPTVREEKVEAGRRFRLLPLDIGAMVQATRRTWFREPQVKAMWIQQTAFLLAPVILFQVRTPPGDTDVGGLLAIMVPFVLPMSHLHFASNLFGLDGRGVMSLMLTPVRRARILLARGIAVGGFCLLTDLALVLLILLGSGLVADLRDEGAATMTGLARYLPLTPWIFIAVALTDIVLFAVGTVTSVYLPSRLATAGRRPIQGQRVENAGCAAQLLRFIIFIPALGLGAALSVLALAPVFELLVPEPFLAIDRVWLLATVPGAFLVAIGIYVAAVYGASRGLLEREEKLLHALIDRGD